MSEEERKDPPEGDEPPDSPAEGEDELAKLRRQARHHKAERDKFAAEAKKNADAAARLAEIEDAQKSEVEKLTEAQRAAEARAADAELRALRLEVAATKGLTPGQARRLSGSTLEELEADADEFLAELKPPSSEGSETEHPRRPQERLVPGARPQAEPQLSAKEIVDKAEALSAI